MPVDLLALGAAFLSGLLGSVHCAAMCGGIATGLGAASGASSGLGRALELNLARVTSYVLAGAVVGGLGSLLLRVVEQPALALVLRVTLGVAMMLLALRLAGAGDRWNLLARTAKPLWRALTPLQRRLLPAHTLGRRLALGMLWGWMPCGLSSSLLVVAWLQAEAWHGALVMAAFGVGTAPAMVALTWSGTRLGHARRTSGRRAAAAFVFCAGAITATTPWLLRLPAVHPVLEALGCRPI